MSRQILNLNFNFRHKLYREVNFWFSLYPTSQNYYFAKLEILTEVNSELMKLYCGSVSCGLPC